MTLTKALEQQCTWMLADTENLQQKDYQYLTPKSIQRHEQVVASYITVAMQIFRSFLLTGNSNFKGHQDSKPSN